jgi:hypothetical protein
MLLRLPGDSDVDLAAFESEERRRLEAAIAQLSPDADDFWIGFFDQGTMG